MSFDYYQSVIGKMRKGTADDSFIDVNETLQVVNSKVVLSEIPDKFNGLVVKTIFGNTTLVEIKKGTPTDNQYLCDYNLGVVHFPDTVNNERYVFSYKGRGAVYLAAERIYTKQMNSEEIIQTLRDVLDEADSIINLSERFTNTGVYSATKVYYGRNIVTYDNAAYMCINHSADGIINIPPTNTTHWMQMVSVKQAIEVANAAASSANTAATNANTATTNANNAADYANEQGDYAKGIRDNFGHKGDYSPTATYKNGNVVTYGGINYFCIQDTTAGIDPLNGAYWTVVSPQASINDKTWTATEGQTVFTITNGNYVPDQGNIEVWVGGVPQVSGVGYTETNNTTITLSEGVTAGTTVFAKWYEGHMSISKGHKSSHALGGQDEIDLTQMRNYKEKVSDEFDRVDAYLAEIAVNVKNHGVKADGVTDDTTAFQSVVNTFSNIFIPSNMKLSGDITLSKPIKISGVKKPVYSEANNNLTDGTVISGGGLIISSTGVKINDLGIYCPTLDNGIDASTAPLNSLEIKNVIVMARDHGYLFQSYNGTVKGATVDNCDSVGGIHGFISKAENVNFSNCRARNHTTNGFGIISDNIPGVSKVGNAKHNSLVNCYAESCYSAFKMYARDMFSTNNANGIRSSGHSLSNCYAINCTEGYAIGDSGIAPTGVTYIEPFDISITNSHQTGATGVSFNVNRVDRITIDNVSVERTLLVDYSLAKFVNIGKVNSYLEKIGTPDEIHVLEAGNSAPSLASGKSIFKLNNSAAQSIYHFAGGKDRHVITVLFTENNSVITNGGNFKLNRGSYSGKGSWLILKLQNGAWEEVIGHCVGVGSVSIALGTSGTLDLTKGSVFDVAGTGTTANKITVANKLQDTETLTVIIRSTSGNFTYGGFDTTKFIVPASFPLTAAFGTAIMSQWVYMNAVSKWVCISQTTAPYV